MNMKRLFLAIPIGSFLLVCASAASAQESAKVQITVKISDKTPSFKNQRLVIMLYHDYPTQDDRGNKAVDSHINAKFSHDKGKATTLTFTLGEKMKIQPGVQYTVNVTVFDPASKVTHVSERNGLSGPFNVLTNGGRSKLAILLRPES